MAVSGMTCCSSGSILTFLLIGLILILSGEGVNTWEMQDPCACAEGGESLRVSLFLGEVSQLGTLHLLPERGVGHVRAEGERHLSPAPGLDHRLVWAAHAAKRVVKVVPGQSSPLRKMKGPGIVQDVGPQRGVGRGDGSGQCPLGDHRVCGGDQGGSSLADPQLLEVQGGDTLAPALHLLVV